MKWNECKAALHEGKKIKLASWENAYWYLNEDGELINHFEEGQELPTHALFPRDLLMVMSDKWEIVDDVVAKSEADMGCFSFSEALVYLKQGEKVARKGWNGKKQYIQLATGISHKAASGEIVNCEHEAIGNQAIAFVGTSGVQMGWLASQADMLADDWQFAE